MKLRSTPQRSNLRVRLKSTTAGRGPTRRGLTLVEILVAMTITLLLILGMAQVFAMIGTGMENRRSILQMSGQMRGVLAQLEDELQGVTVPLRPWSGATQGYFEYVEGIATDTSPAPSGVPREGVSTLFGDVDDRLAFTTRRVGTPYLGQRLHPGPNGVWGNPGDDDGNGIADFDPVTGLGDLNEAGFPGSDDTLVTFESELAEVIYAVVYVDNDPVLDAVDAGASPPPSIPEPGQGEVSLHRRAVLIRPDLALLSPRRVVPGFVPPNQLMGRFTIASGSSNDLRDAMLHINRFLAKSDISTHLTIAGTGPVFISVWANTLTDLARRENRYAHNPVIVHNGGSPPTYASTATGAAAALRAFPHQMSVDPLYQNNTLFSATSVDQRFRFPRRDSTDPLEQLHYLHYGDEAGETIALSQLLAFDIRAFDTAAKLRADAGPDGAWGTAGLDDNNDNVPDNILEAGWPASDDSEGMTVQDGLIQQWLASTGTPANLNTRFPVVGTGAFVDLGYVNHIPVALRPAYVTGALRTQFSTAPTGMPPTYDTWTHDYERDGIDQNNGPVVNLANNGLDDNDNNVIDDAAEATYSLVDEGLNGLDDDGVNGVDDPGERETAPPYAVPLRGLRIGVRVYDPKTRQVRQGTVSVDFIPE